MVKTFIFDHAVRADILANKTSDGLISIILAALSDRKVNFALNIALTLQVDLKC